MLKSLGIKKNLKAVRHHLVKHIHTFLDNPFLFSGTGIFLFPFSVREIEASFSICAQWSNSSPTIFPEGESCPSHNSWSSSVSQTSSACSTQHLLPPSLPVQELGIPNAPTTPGQNVTHGTVPEENQTLPASSTQSAAWVWCQPPDRTNRKDFGVTAAPPAQLALLWVLHASRRMAKNS